MDMEWKRIFKIIPIPVFYVKDVGGGFAGRSYGIFIKVVDRYKGDDGLLNHELLHCKQFYATGGFHALMYTFISRYRLWAEVKCYQEQLNFYPKSEYDRLVLRYAGFIANNYRLQISVEDAAKALKKY